MTIENINMSDTISIDLSDLTTVTSITSVSNITNPFASSTGIYTPNGTSAGTSPYNYNYNWITSGTDTITLGDYNATLDVKGDANFEGDIKIKGKSLVDALEKIEEKLAILRPNDALEEKWEQLRNLRKQYMELEKDIIEKEKIWDILKK